MATHDIPSPEAAGVPTPSQDTVGTNRRARKAMLGAWFGFYVDLFDIYLPIVALAPAIAYFVSPDLGTTGVAVVSGAIFASTLIGRPVGAAIFGKLADTVGRKRVTIVAITGAGVVTLLIALLPGYQQIGIGSVILFILLRLLAGVFLGGEYTGANPLAMEAAPRHKRGLYSGIINTGFPLAYASVSLITLLLLLVLPSSGVDSAYAQWGWRVPFIIGAVLSFVLVWYFHRSVEESEVFTKTERTESPLKQLFSGANLGKFFQVFALMTGFWLSLQPVAANLPILLGDDGVGLSSELATLLLVVSYVLLAGSQVAAAVLSQRFGRRRFLLWASMMMACGAVPLYFLLVYFGHTSTLWSICATILLVQLVVGPWGMLTAYINERFPTSIRASGYGLAYSLAVVAPSFYAFYQAGLSAIMPFNYTGMVLLAVGALFIVGAALAGPETKDVNFTEEYADQGGARASQ
ncbi:putative MFS family arabinose efflux permease [Tamaricihabitans halophyticus]|uniref:Putative MFS family arabinose efflux permease n=1 Tax=Tamaricihabitans halophyticus TaxID=1262583 RepID=A0A4R2QLJ9_9PSEU|nr:MFS transporter [Tamaricihabitans halophyticus]TCP47875.1 putative MFS family arabinose efflux permease [Tamaricihabitans halophyticus]